MTDAGSPSPNAQFAAWMKAVADHGDRAAFAKLFQHFAPRLKAYMLSLGSTNDLVEELAQETMLIIWRRAKSHNPETTAGSTWIFTIA
jgi:DNA-directed RNA polymerase specialized sigma24 family protein